MFIVSADDLRHSAPIQIAELGDAFHELLLSGASRPFAEPRSRSVHSRRQQLEDGDEDGHEYEANLRELDALIRLLESCTNASSRPPPDQHVSRPFHLAHALHREAAIS
jgi:hypothetical protein